ncbi:probable imidazolonepropionase isoform X2 [Mercenaria mercenaria]|uniref:probable imidazolonepropionase isoform X2 n=1 Tax=Mercenaria mercenaria TaxID=6596 RepID=UPI00234ECBD7|nr:probable imidazolonepropionase isoform X2 [Mercenaria mercenaria]
MGTTPDQEKAVSVFSDMTTLYPPLYITVAIFDGIITDIGKDSEVRERNPDVKAETTIDAKGLSIIPGLVDAHTHPVWAGDRVHEFAMKLAGATYMDVHKAGGGIHYTVEHTRKASEEDLYASFKDRLQAMCNAGTTLVECKSGYGLDVATEVKMLRVIERAKREMAIGVSSTYCGAHAVPKDSTAEEATRDVLEKQIPEIQRLMADDILHVDNIDVFCERGVFDVEQSRSILEKGKELGLTINFHGDELHPTGSAEMGAEIGALAISHLEEISDAGMSAMAASGSVGVVLPTTAYILRLKPPPVRQMIESGMAVALGSDFNPNAYCLAMPIVMHLACVILRMSMPETLNAATINAAYALNVSDKHGSLEVGKYGNFVVLDTDRWENLIYKFGSYTDVVKNVIYMGQIVHSKDDQKVTKVKQI